MEKPTVYSDEDETSLARTSRLEMLLRFSSLPYRSIRLNRVALDVLSGLDACACVIQRVSGGHLAGGGAFQTRGAMEQGHVQSCLEELATGVISGRRTVSLQNLAAAGARVPAEAAFNSYLGAPIFGADGELAGVIAVLGSKPGGFCDEGEWWLRVVAHFCSAALTIESIEGKLAAFQEAVAQPQPEEHGGRQETDETPAARGGGTPGVKGDPGTPPPKGLILLVDDDRTVNAVVRRRLVKYGYHVDTAFDGLEALRLFRPEEHDVVVSDIKMPHMSGWELIKALKVKAPNLSAFLITGYSSGGGIWNQAFLNKHGVVEVLNKPIDFDYLDSAIEGQILLRRRRTAV